MKIVDQGIVIRGRPKTDGASCCFPSICVLPTGRWLAAFRLAPAKLGRSQRAYVAWSDDEGGAWSGPTEVAPWPADFEGKAGSWRSAACTAIGGSRVAAILMWEDATNPLVPMFNEETEGIVDMKPFLAISEDGGEHFSQPRRIARGRYDAQPTPATGAILLLASEEWAAPFEVNKHYDDPAPWQHASCLTFSSDKGATWKEQAIVHADPARRMFCWDQRIAVLPRGELLALFWTFDRETSTYLNIHARRSSDSGRTWGPLVDVGVPGQPARPVGLSDGRVVMVYVDRAAEPRIKARCSQDGGRSWPADSELLIHQRAALRSETWDKRSMQDAWAEMNEFSIGLPDAVRLPNDDVLTVYYSGDRPDLTDVLWSRIRA
jgi:hypothetical protein